MRLTLKWLEKVLGLEMDQHLTKNDYSIFSFSGSVVYMMLSPPDKPMPLWSYLYAKGQNKNPSVRASFLLFKHIAT